VGNVGINSLIVTKKINNLFKIHIALVIIQLGFICG